jgi:hypothetical protein
LQHIWFAPSGKGSKSKIKRQKGLISENGKLLIFPPIEHKYNYSLWMKMFESKKKMKKKTFHTCSVGHKDRFLLNRLNCFSLIQMWKCGMIKKLGWVQLNLAAISYSQNCFFLHAHSFGASASPKATLLPSGIVFHHLGPT